MRLHRFIGDYDLGTQSIEIGDPRVVRQIRSVLRLQIGEEIILCDGKGTDARTRITSMKAKAIEVEVYSLSKNETESPITCILWCAILKKDSFEWVVQKCTEIGVTHIFPIMSKRTVKGALSSSRLDAIAREAAEQSGRGRVPTIFEPIAFEQAVADATKQGLTLFCDTSATEELCKIRMTGKKSRNLFIGPEGGWDPYEIDRARMSGAHIVSLGKTTLRAETAAIVGSYSVIHSRV